MASSHPGAAPREGASLQEHARRPTETAQQQAPPQQGISQQPENQQPSKDTQPDGSPKEHDSIKSWAAIEGEMKKEDEATMKGHMEDVDYLLVFAGLFSAVLTAFVVESYQQLQPDHEETSSKLLRRISIQLESFTLTPRFANSTHPVHALPSLDFTADATARWINILWFLSLIFSLAAALFGILVKQWIREYMRWNAVLAHPRDNVLVRQIRFEAWNDWNVPTTIAAVPALLEIALVFFVCGLVILLWTLDPVVSTVVTTAAAVFLAVASTFTFLPAFFRRSPYKSPTAWACAILFDFLTLHIPHKFRSLQRAVGYWLWRRGRVGRRVERFGGWLRKTSGLDYGHPRIGNWTAFAHDWRSRDLANLWSSLWPGTKRGDAIPLLEELRLECTGPPTDFWVPRSYWDSLPTLLHNAQRTITELSPLVRALAWVSQASQDARTQAHVLSCVESLETRFTLPHDLFFFNFFDEDEVRAVSYWHLALDVQRRRARAAGRNPTANERKDIVSLRDNIKLRDADIDARSGFYSKPEGYVSMRAYWIELWNTSPGSEALILVRLLVFTIEALVSALLDPQLSPLLREQDVQRLRQYLAVLYYFGRWSDLFSGADYGDRLYDTFEGMMHQNASIRNIFPGWGPVLLGTAHVIGSPKLKKLINELEIEVEYEYDWSPSPQDVSKIITALSSVPPSTTCSQAVQPYAAIQDSHEANPSNSTDDSTGSPPETPSIDVALSPALPTPLRHSASLSPAASPLLSEPLSRPSGIPAEKEGTMSDPTSSPPSSPPQPGSNEDEDARLTAEPAGNAPQLQSADIPPIETPSPIKLVPSTDLSLLQSAEPSPSSPSPGSPSASPEFPGQHDGAPGDHSGTRLRNGEPTPFPASDEEKQRTANDPSTTRISLLGPLSHRSSREYEHVHPADDPADSSPGSLHSVSQVESAPPPGPSSSRASGSSNLPHGAPSHDSSAASAESPRQRAAVLHETKSGAARLEGKDDGPEAFGTSVEEERGVATNAAGADA